MLLPREKGSYILIMDLSAPLSIQVGKLGLFHFQAGHYAYCGSAMGPGGLSTRVGRHLRRKKKLRWHIDYLLTAMTVSQVLIKESAERSECLWAAQLIETNTDSPLAALNLGSSDCSCPTHLIRLDQPLALTKLLDTTGCDLLDVQN